MTCCMCGTTGAVVFWTITLPLRRDGMTRTVCNACEIKHRRERAAR